MPRGGGNKKSALARELDGSETRKWHRLEPKPQQLGAEPPPGLTGEEMTYWEYYAPILMGMKTLSIGDRDTLRLYCVALARLDELNDEHRAMMEEEDVVLRVKASQTTDAQRRHWFERCRLTAQELGLTPASRARVTVVDEAATDEFAEFDRPRLVEG